MSRSPSLWGNSMPMSRAHLHNSTRLMRHTFSGWMRISGSLERLARVAFDDTVNIDLRLGASIRFAETVGVPDSLILRTTDDLDSFIEE